MPYIFKLLALVLIGVCPVALAAEGENWAEIMAETKWDWHPGDLIFRNELNAFDDIIREAEGGHWASVGIMRASSGSPRVVYADQEQGVTEVMIEDFLEGLADEEYSVYRVVSLDSNAPGRQMVQGPIARFALRKAYGAPFDRALLLSNEGYYNAELPYVAALSHGIELGTPSRLGELAAESDTLKDAVLEDWRSHPLCTHFDETATREQCWSTLYSVRVITPRQLTSSSAVTRVFPK